MRWTFTLPFTKTYDMDRHIAPLTGTVHSLATLFPATLRSQLKVGKTSSMSLAKCLLYRSCSGCHYFCKIAGNLLRKSTGLSHPDISHSRRRNVTKTNGFNHQQPLLYCLCERLYLRAGCGRWQSTYY